MRTNRFSFPFHGSGNLERFDGKHSTFLRSFGIHVGRFPVCVTPIRRGDFQPVPSTSCRYTGKLPHKKRGSPLVRGDSLVPGSDPLCYWLGTTQMVRRFYSHLHPVQSIGVLYNKFQINFFPPLLTICFLGIEHIKI